MLALTLTKPVTVHTGHHCVLCHEPNATHFISRSLPSVEPLVLPNGETQCAMEIARVCKKHLPAAMPLLPSATQRMGVQLVWQIVDLNRGRVVRQRMPTIRRPIEADPQPQLELAPVERSPRVSLFAYVRKCALAWWRANVIDTLEFEEVTTPNA